MFCFWPPPCRGLWSQWRRLCFTLLLWTLQKTDYFSDVVKYLLASQHKTTCTHWAWQLDVYMQTHWAVIKLKNTKSSSVQLINSPPPPSLVISLVLPYVCSHSPTHTFLLFISADRSSKTPESIKSNTCLEPTSERRKQEVGREDAVGQTEWIWNLPENSSRLRM